MTITGYLSIAKDIVSIISPLIAVAIAGIGLHAWKRQLKGKSAYDLSQKLLHAVYKIRNAIHEARVPFIYTGEMEQAKQEAGIEGNLIDTAVRSRCMIAVYNNRWRKVITAYEEFEVGKIEAEALWGNIIHDIFSPLHQCVTKLKSNLDMYCMTIDDQESLDRDALERIRQVIYYRSDDDPYSIELSTATTTVEDFIRKRMQL